MRQNDLCEATHSDLAPAASDASQNPLIELLDKTQERLEEYPSIEEDLRQDLLVDVATLRTQLRRKNVNVQVALALLDPFAQVEFLGDSVGRFKQLLLEDSDSTPN